MSNDRWLQKISRRRFLQGTSGLTLALPFLPSVMTPHLAMSQTLPPPRRFISFFTGNGQRRVNLYPQTGADPAWVVRDSSQNVREFLLRNYAGGLSPSGPGLSKIFGPGFNPLRDKMTIMRGLDCIGTWASHNGNTMLSSGATEKGNNAETIDSILSKSPKVYPGLPRVPLYHPYLTNDSYSVAPVSIDSSGTKIQPIFNPAVGFNLLFGNQTPANDPSLQNRKSRQLKVIDAVREEFLALRNNSRLGSEDKARLDDHAAKISDLQNRLNAAPTTLACTPGIKPSSSDVPTASNFQTFFETHLDLLALAIKCDVTRVATVALGHPTDTFPFNYFISGAVSEDHHSISHSASYNIYDPVNTPLAESRLGDINRWYADRILNFLNQINVPEPGTSGTYLDNSLVLWGNEDGSADHDVHRPYSMPTVLWGSLGGKFLTGRYVDYRRPDALTPAGSAENGQWHGRPYNQLILSILDGFGLTPAEYERVGRAGYGTYTGTSGRGDDNTIYSQFIDTDAKRRALLPFFKA